MVFLFLFFFFLSQLHQKIVSGPECLWSRPAVYVHVCVYTMMGDSPHQKRKLQRSDCYFETRTRTCYRLLSLPYDNVPLTGLTAFYFYFFRPTKCRTGPVYVHRVSIRGSPTLWREILHIAKRWLNIISHHLSSNKMETTQFRLVGFQIAGKIPAAADAACCLELRWLIIDVIARVDVSQLYK